MAEGIKTVETRGHKTNVRGRIGIASTKSRPSHIATVGDWAIGANHASELGGRTIDLPRGCLVATAELVDCRPITASAIDGTPTIARVVVPTPGRGDGSIVRLWDDDGRSCVSITEQLPYGDYREGRFAWLLENIKPTTRRCPACWDRPPEAAPGVCVSIDGDWWHTPGSCRYCTNACKVCIGGTRRVDPIPVKGKQGWWWWTP